MRLPRGKCVARARVVLHTRMGCDLLRALGVDPSSGVSGLAVAETDSGHIEWFSAFHTHPDKPLWENMMEFSNEVKRVLSAYAPIEVVVIEKVSVSWNVNTIRKIAYYEACAMLEAHDNPYVEEIFQPQATKARRMVLGKGNLSKEKCFELVKARFSDVEFDLAKDGGMDQADAVILALAAEALAAEA